MRVPYQFACDLLARFDKDEDNPDEVTFDSKEFGDEIWYLGEEGTATSYKYKVIRYDRLDYWSVDGFRTFDELNEMKQRIKKWQEENGNDQNRASET